MFIVQPSRTLMAEHPEIRSSIHVPMVYEKVAAEPIRWEYHVLTVDTSEQALPTAEQLNELGNKGWVLAGMLDERASGKGNLVHFYFVRQSME
ncbi:MAG TPA: hypothetical protein VFU49_16325 [Ktedonobacteraceae bacterium]|nr:hypothetical protein [Ktedonobacteraceae bacterium]